MSYVLIFILFVWVLVLQDKITTIKTELQKLIDGGFAASKSETKEDKSTVQQVFDETQTTSELWQNETGAADEFQFVHNTTEDIKPEVQEDMSSQEMVEKTEKIDGEKTGFEKIFLGSIFNKIGAIAIILGMIFFIKVVSQYIVFTPVIKICIAFFAGAGMVAGALKLHKDNMKNYAEVLLGTGFAVLFTTIYCAASLYHIIPSSAAIALGVLLVLMTYYTADRLNTFSTFLIGFAGGYLNPFFANSNISMDFLFGYLLFLNLIGAVYVYKNESKKAVNYINLILTCLVIVIFAAEKNLEINYLFPAALWSLYLVNDIAGIFKYKNNESYTPNQVFNILNFLVYLVFIKLLCSENITQAGIFTIGAMAVYAIFFFVFKAKDSKNAKYFADGFVISLWSASYLLLKGTIRVDIWALEGLMLSYFAARHKYLSIRAAVFLITAFTAAFFVPNAVMYKDLSTYHPIFNFRLALFGIPALCAYLSAICIKEQKNYADTLKFLSLSSVYMFLLFETNSMCAKYINSQNVDVFTIKMLIYSIIGFIYALNTKRLAHSLNSALFNYAGGLMFLLSTLLLVSSSFSYENTGMLAVLNLRFAAYLFAIGTSVYYLRKTKSNFFSYLAVIFGFLCTHFEISHITSQNPLGISVSWILYAGIITLCGIFMNKRTLTKSGIWIFILALLKVMLFDIANMETLYKFITFLTLGVILMIVSYFYSKIKQGSN